MRRYGSLININPSGIDQPRTCMKQVSLSFQNSYYLCTAPNFQPFFTLSVWERTKVGKNQDRRHHWSTRPDPQSRSPVVNIVFAWNLFCFARFWKDVTDGWTTSAKTIITTGRVDQNFLSNWTFKFGEVFFFDFAQRDAPKNRSYEYAFLMFI